MTQPRVYNPMATTFCQTAYVTTDLERAMPQVGAAHGIRDWFSSSGFEFQMGKGRSGHIDLALAYVGDMQIEVIQPLDGDLDFYRCMFSGDDFQIKFHHLCKSYETRAEFDAKVAELNLAGIDLPVERTQDTCNDRGVVCYADFRQQMGHFMEYVWFGAAGRAWMNSIPRN